MTKLDLHRIFGNKIFEFLAVISGTFSILSCEMHYGWPSPSLPILTNGTYRFQLSNEEASWVAVILLIGIIIGAIGFAVIGNRLGRKTIILATAVPLFFAWILICLANSFTTLLIARTLAGIASGFAFSVMPIYIAEISEAKLRGMLSSFCPICVVIGTLLINSLGNYIAINDVAIIASAVPFLLFITFIWMPESPLYYLLQNQTDECQKAYKILTNTDLSDENLQKMQNTLISDGDAKFLDIFRKSYNRNALWIGLGLRTVQQLAGSTAITFYCKTIFEEANDELSSDIATIIYFSVQLVFVFISTLIVDVIGRRPLLLISVLGTTISLTVTATILYLKNATTMDTTSYSFISIIAMLLYVIFFSIGLRTVPIIMLGEIFAPNIKTTGLALATVYHSSLAILSTKIFHITIGYMHWYFFASSCCGIFSLLFVYFFVPETRGKSLEDIQDNLKASSQTKL